MKKNFYFCTVKSLSDTKSLQPSSVFCARTLFNKNIAATCGVTVTSPRHRLESLTARIAAFVLSNF